MDLLDALPLPLALTLLALADGLSVGTLLIPLFLLLAPGRPRVRRIMLYLGTITGFYLLVGVLAMLGIVSLIRVGQEFLDSRAGQIAVLAAGIACIAIALAMWAADSRRKRRGAAGGPGAGSGEDADGGGTVSGGGRLLRWRARLLDDRTTRAAVMGVALAAGLVEVATMLPYLIGMTLLAEAQLAMPARFAMLAGYCLVMIVPALVLLAARVFAAGTVEHPLQRLADWMQRTGSETTSWLFGIIGFLLARGAASQLGIQLPFVG